MRALELLRLHAPRLADRTDAIKVVDAAIEESARICDAISEDFKESARDRRSSDDFDVAGKHDDIGDELAAVAQKIRALKSGL